MTSSASDFIPSTPDRLSKSAAGINNGNFDNFDGSPIKSPSRIGFSPSKKDPFSEPILGVCQPCSNRPFDNKEVLRCMFCGGGTCKRCGPEAYLRQEKSALERIHSSWINPSIIAMQRPSEAMFENTNLLAQFKTNRVTAVFNLTEPGEHPFCGTGNQMDSGFPYSPETLMKAGIKHFNYCWPDMTAPSMTLMMDIVQVAQNELSQEGKIAVHCHAGYGRTGLAIACILIASELFSAAEAITLVRQRRPGSIQTKFQATFIHDFEIHWYNIIAVFPSNTMPNCNIPKSITKSVQDQLYSLAVDELSNESLKYLAKIIHLCISGIMRYITDNNSAEEALQVCTAVCGLRINSSSSSSSSDRLPEIFSFVVNPDFFDKMKKEVTLNNWTSVINAVSDLFSTSQERSMIRDFIAGGDTATPAAVKLELLHTLSQCIFSWFSTRSDFVFSDDLIDQLKVVWGCIDYGNIEKETNSSSGGSRGGEVNSNTGKLSDSLALSSIIQALESGLNRMKFHHLSAVVQTLTALRGKVTKSLSREKKARGWDSASAGGDESSGSTDNSSSSNNNNENSCSNNNSSSSGVSSGRGSSSSNNDRNSKDTDITSFDIVDLALLRFCLSLSSVCLECPTALVNHSSSISPALIGILNGKVVSADKPAQSAGSADAHIDGVQGGAHVPLWRLLAGTKYEYSAQDDCNITNSNNNDRSSSSSSSSGVNKDKIPQFDAKIIDKLIISIRTVSLLEYCEWKYVLPSRLKLNFNSPK